MKRYIGKRPISVFSLFLFLVSCSCPYLHWYYEETRFCEIDTCCTRLFLPSTDLFRGLDIELMRTPKAMYLYISCSSVPFPFDPNDSDKVLINVTLLDDEIPYAVLADRLEGGQRVLMPSEMTRMIIEELLEDRPVTITIGRYEALVVATEFGVLFDRMECAHQ